MRMSAEEHGRVKLINLSFQREIGKKFIESTNVAIVTLPSQKLKPLKITNFISTKKPWQRKKSKGSGRMIDSIEWEYALNVEYLLNS